ncbi:hypothetical protein QO002_001645 [Pararhizobium capsulatum DSM 1112]|uniref:Uncharacterized protein n=1 Tax=Pararhizobium capsulatum DSM 1112 TaxID=1121113 RepID=A0ABU0BRK7_9HYPH|nr:hypothetical protein [Pararhizobium capsulatum DSM 1112]
MLKIFSRHKSRSNGIDSPEAVAIDLLGHPDIARMDARELGDLPFPRAFEADCRRGNTCPLGSSVQAKASVTLTSPTNSPFQLCMA